MRLKRLTKKEKQRRIVFRKNRRKELIRFAKSLQLKEIKSEKWFMEYVKSIGFVFPNNTLFNVQFMSKYIPDIQNRQYKFIIEIDGSIHDTETQKLKDAKKDTFYKSNGYLVFRVKHFDEAEASKVINDIKNIVKEYNKQREGSSLYREAKKIINDKSKMFELFGITFKLYDHRTYCELEILWKNKQRVIKFKHLAFMLSTLRQLETYVNN